MPLRLSSVYYKENTVFVLIDLKQVKKALRQAQIKTKSRMNAISLSYPVKNKNVEKVTVEVRD